MSITYLHSIYSYGFHPTYFAKDHADDAGITIVGSHSHTRVAPRALSSEKFGRLLWVLKLITIEYNLFLSEISKFCHPSYLRPLFRLKPSYLEQHQILAPFSFFIIIVCRVFLSYWGAEEWYYSSESIDKTREKYSEVTKEDITSVTI